MNEFHCIFHAIITSTKLCGTKNINACYTSYAQRLLLPLSNQVKKKKSEQENNISSNSSLPILHKAKAKKKKEKKIKDNPIDVISFVTRLGKDSLCSSFPSLQRPKVSEVSLRTNKYTFYYADFS